MVIRLKVRHPARDQTMLNGFMLGLRRIDLKNGAIDGINFKKNV
jgi:hypothetical protein